MSLIFWLFFRMSSIFPRTENSGCPRFSLEIVGVLDFPWEIVGVLDFPSIFPIFLTAPDGALIPPDGARTYPQRPSTAVKKGGYSPYPHPPPTVSSMASSRLKMFEAVGESYFECIARNLKSGGRAGIQTIVIGDALFECYRKGTDFIPQYSFPDGRLPSPKVFK